MGPNSGGGHKRKAQAAKDKNTPTRARFSNWKPPSKGVKDKFSKQKQDRSSGKNIRGGGGSRSASSSALSASRIGADSQSAPVDRIIIQENIIRALMKVFGQEYESLQTDGGGVKGISMAPTPTPASVHKGNAQPLPPPPPTVLAAAPAPTPSSTPTTEPPAGPAPVSIAPAAAAAAAKSRGATGPDWGSLAPVLRLQAERYLQLGFTEAELWATIKELTATTTATAGRGAGGPGGKNGGRGGKPSSTECVDDELFLALIMRASGHPSPVSGRAKPVSASGKGSKGGGAVVAPPSDAHGMTHAAAVAEMVCNEDLMGEVDVLGSIFAGGDGGDLATVPLVLFGTPVAGAATAGGARAGPAAPVASTVGGIPCMRLDVSFSVEQPQTELLLTLYIYHGDTYPMGKASLGVTDGSRVYGWLQLKQQQGKASSDPAPLTRSSLRKLSLAGVTWVQQRHQESEAPVAFDFIQWMTSEAPTYTGKGGGDEQEGCCFLGSEAAACAPSSGSKGSSGVGTAEPPKAVSLSAAPQTKPVSNAPNDTGGGKKDKGGKHAGKAGRQQQPVASAKVGAGGGKVSGVTASATATGAGAGEDEFDPDAPIVPPTLSRPLTRHMEGEEYRSAFSRALSNGLTGASARRAARDEMEFVMPASALKELIAEVKYAVAMQERAYSVQDIGTKETIEGSKLMLERMAPRGLNKAQCKELYLSAKDLLFKKGDWFARDASAMRDKLVLTGMMIHAERMEKKEQKRKAKNADAGSAAADVAAMSISSHTPAPPAPAPAPLPLVPKLQPEPEAEADEEDSEDSEEEEEEDSDAEPTPEELEVMRRKEEARRKKQRADSEMLLRGLDEKKKLPNYQEMLSRRQNLPAFKMKDEVLRAIEDNSVVVISGDTGCGKTTQIPQLVLDDYIEKGKGGECNIIVTQPRRISAVSVAEHISRERAENIGQSTGYHIRLEAKKGPSTRLLLMTTGVLLRRLQTEANLGDVSHVFVDEVHERDINTDFLLIVLKQLLRRNPQLKVVLMSATLNANMFVDYFAREASGSASSKDPRGIGSCAMLSIPGRAFPVTTYFLEDALEHTGVEVRAGSDCAYKAPRGGSSAGKGYAAGGGYKGSGGSKGKEKTPEQLRREMLQAVEALSKQRKLSPRTVQSLNTVDEGIINLELIQGLVMYLMKQKPEGDSGGLEKGKRGSAGSRSQQQAAAILIFVPGLGDIRGVIDALEERQELRDGARILPLHSSLSSHEQSLVFQLPPSGKRKIIVSTNIAETSVTIEDVVYVIDTCKVKENSFDEDVQMNVLQEQWHSQANARQRRGRAGRVRAGVCYHLCCSFTLPLLPAYTEPEMRRMSLEELILQVLALDLGNPYEFLGSALSPPETVAVTNAIMFLESLNAVLIEGSSAKANVADAQVIPCQITPLGFHLAALPISPRIGKLMLFGVLLRCIDPVLTIASIVSAKSPFVSPFNERDAADAAKLGFMDGNSDLITMLNAYDSWRAIVDKGQSEKESTRKEEEQYCRSKFLSLTSLRLVDQMRGQFLQLLKGIGFMPSSVTNRNIRSCEENASGGSMGMIKSAICAGLSPNILMVPAGGGGSAKPGQSSATASFGAQTMAKSLGELALQQRRKASALSVHPSSVMSACKRLDSKFLVYLESIKTSKMYARDVTTVLPLTMALFSGRLKCNEQAGYVLVDGWIKLACAPKVVKCLLMVTDAVDDAFMEKVVDPTSKSSETWKQVLKIIEIIT